MKVKNNFHNKVAMRPEMAKTFRALHDAYFLRNYRKMEN